MAISNFICFGSLKNGRGVCMLDGIVNECYYFNDEN